MPSVVSTRPIERNSSQDAFHSILKSNDVELLEMPMIRFLTPKETAGLDKALLLLAESNFDFCILSSPTAVEFFLGRITELQILPSQFVGTRFGAVGAATARALAEIGIETELPIPVNAGSQELLRVIPPAMLQGRRVLLLQSQIGLDHLGKSLNDSGAITERVVLYETHGPSLATAALFIHALENESKPDIIAFFSPSSVLHCIRTLAEMASGLIRGLPPIACIGETTAKAIEESLRRRPEIVASKANQASLAEDIIKYLQIKKLI